MSAVGSTDFDGTGNGQISQFLVPEAMLTPGVAGGMTMVISNALAVNFDAPGYASVLGLIFSFMFGALIITSNRQWWTRIIYYVFNSLIIFCVAFGAGNLAATSRLPNVPTASLLFPSAYAESTSRGSSDLKNNPEENAKGSDRDRRSERPAGTRDNADRNVQRPDPRFFQPWTNPFTK